MAVTQTIDPVCSLPYPDGTDGFQMWKFGLFQFSEEEEPLSCKPDQLAGASGRCGFLTMDLKWRCWGSLYLHCWPSVGWSTSSLQALSILIKIVGDHLQTWFWSLGSRWCEVVGKYCVEITAPWGVSVFSVGVIEVCLLRAGQANHYMGVELLCHIVMYTLGLEEKIVLQYFLWQGH